jgi:hypothetical protein
MLLIATLVQYPGVGGGEPLERVPGTHHNALMEVQSRLHKVARTYGVNVMGCSIPTLRKDLTTLRQWGLLNQPIYRWGYFIGTGVMNSSELQVALNALYSQAQYQNDPQVNQIYQSLTRRLRGMEVKDEILYPVRTQIDKVIVYTNPEEMMAKGQYRHTLFHELKTVETAILQGCAIELFHSRNPYSTAQPRYVSVYPLQLIYSDIAWYLLFEECANGHFAAVRIDRFSEHCRPLDLECRGSNIQMESLQAAHKLLENGWGLYLGNPKEQQMERLGQLSFVPTTVRFFPPVLEFILEGERRHPNQKIKEGPKVNGKFAHVDYRISLPPRSLNSFSQWVYRFMNNAQVLWPPELVEKHQTAAKGLYDRYLTKEYD